MNPSSIVRIIIDGDETEQSLDSIIIDDLNAELNLAKEFWVVQVPEIKQLVQIAVVSENKIIFEHYEDGNECRIDEKINQIDKAYIYLKKFLISIGLDGKTFHNERKKQINLEQNKSKNFLKILNNKKELVLFSFALVNEKSPLYIIDKYGRVDQKQSTNLVVLYQEGWKLIDIDKTGKSAQLEDFNFIVRLSK